MLPVDPGEGYGDLVTYGAKQPEYLPLPARIDGFGGTFTVWSLSFEERQAILDGANIGLRLLTFGYPLQPVHLGVQGTESWPYDERDYSNLNDEETT